jgi:hypothetical protein
MRTQHPEPTATVVRELVELGCRAPSYHNSQPWRWQTTADGLELWADTSRRLPLSDPAGRNLLISCGAALHHVQAVASATGWEAAVERFPAGPDSDLLARIVLRASTPVPEAGAVLRAVRERRTDRRRFTSWPVPEDLLHSLARLAEIWGAHAVPVVDVTDRFRIDRLVERAADEQARDDAIVLEQQAWIDHGPADGVPARALPAANDSSISRMPARFPAGGLDDPILELDVSDGLIILCGYADKRQDWLRTGEALSAVWLRATMDGLSVVPLSQVVEVDATRHSLQHEVLGGLAAPHLLVRLGWQSLSRKHLDVTPRRPVAEILDP